MRDSSVTIRQPIDRKSVVLKSADTKKRVKESKIIEKRVVCTYASIQRNREKTRGKLINESRTYLESIARI